MHAVHTILFVGLLSSLLTGPTEAFSQNDVQGCQDYPLLTRMPNF